MGALSDPLNSQEGRPVNLLQRVQDILLKPAATWPVIDREPATVAGLYTNYLMILAAIPAVCGFIGLSIIGVGAMGVNFRVPFFSGLVNMVVGYVLSLVAVYVLALIVDALAPTFKGRKDPISALKLVVFASTAGMLGGLFNLIPMLGILGLLAAIYSIYLIYTGIPVLMKCPPDKALGYTAVVIVCGIVMGVVISALAALTLPSPGFGGMGGVGKTGGDVSITLPGSDVKIDTAGMEAMARKMEEAGKQMEAAQKSGDTAAAGKAMGDILGAMGAAGGAPLPAAELKALLPEAIGDLKRESIESQGGQAMGIAGSSAKASYVNGDKRVALTITDLGGIAGIAAVAGWANVTSDRETAEKVEKTYKQGQRTIKEEAYKDGSSSELTVLLANGVMVEADAQRVDAATLKGIVDGVGLDKLESMKRAGR